MAGPLDATLQALGGTATKLGFDFTLDGRSFQARYFAGGQNRPPSLELFTPGRPLGRVAPAGEGEMAGPYRSGGEERLANPAPLVFRAETGLDRFGKRLGLSREAQSGDAAFDARVYVEDAGPSSSVVEAVSRPKVRAAVLALLDARALEVRLETEGTLSARVVMRAGELGAERVRKLAETLASLAEAMPVFAAAGRRRFTVERAAPWVALGGVLSFGGAIFCGVGWQVLDGGLLRVGIGIGLAVFLLAMGVLARAVRGRSTGMRMFLAAGFFGAFGIPAAAVAGLYLVNCGLDGTAPEAHSTQVVKRLVTHGRYTLYYVLVKGWRPERDPVELKVTPAEFDRLPEGTPLVVKTRPGRLGWEWLVP